MTGGKLEVHLQVHGGAGGGRWESAGQVGGFVVHFESLCAKKV